MNGFGHFALCFRLHRTLRPSDLNSILMPGVSNRARNFVRKSGRTWQILNTFLSLFEEETRFEKLGKLKKHNTTLTPLCPSSFWCSLRGPTTGLSFSSVDGRSVSFGLFANAEKNRRLVHGERARRRFRRARALPRRPRAIARIFYSFFELS